MLELVLKFYAVSLLLLFSCAPPEHVYDDAFTPYVVKFKEMRKESCSSYDEDLDQSHQFIKFETLMPSYLGLCAMGPDSFTIKIDKGFWSRASEDERYEVIMHELTHCFLYMGHINEKNHYMNPNEQRITKEMVDKQMVDIFKSKCDE
jgi:hypothetical protein